MFDIFFLILCPIVGYFFYKRNLERRRICEALKDYTGPKPIPFLGNARDFGKNSVEMLQNLKRIQEQYGPITKLFMGPSKIYLIISDPELVEIILTSNKEIRKGIDYQMLRPWLFNGLLLSTGKYWQNRRKLITPAFHFKILDNFIPIFNTESDVLIEKLSRVVDKTSINIWPFLTAFALDSICETAMGTSVKAQQAPDNNYCQSVKTMCENYVKRKFSFWKRIDFLFQFSSDYEERNNALKVLHGFTKSVIERKRKQINSDVNKQSVDKDDLGRKKKIAFLDLLFQFAGNSMTNEDILEEVEVFMFAGHDTTAATACFALYEIARNSNVQEKLVNELKEIFGNDKKIQPTMQDLNNMKYLDLVLKETLRKYPAVPYFSRLLEDDLVFKEQIIPKGVTLTVFSYHMHNDPNIYKHPEVFNPDRFLLKNLDKKNAFAYVPFSAGPRNCIGQKFAFLELKVVISNILRHFRLLPTDPQFDPILSGEVLLKSKNGVCIQLEQRKM